MNEIAAADYHELHRLEDPRVSPDDERIAVVRRTPADEESYTATIFVVPVGGDEASPFTASDGVDGQPRWGPDGDRLAFASTRGDTDRRQCWLLPTDGGEARQLTSVVGGIDDLEWSPDGTRLLFSQRVTRDDRDADRDLSVDSDFEREEPDPRVIDRTTYRADAEYVDGRRRRVYVIDVSAARSRSEADDSDGEAIARLTPPTETDVVGPTWGDSETIYYAAKTGEDPDDSLRYDLYEHDVESDEATAFAETAGWLESGSIDATSAGRVAVEYTPEERASMRQTEIRVHDRETGEERTPTDSLDRTVGHRCTFQWAPDGETLYFTTPREGSRVLWRVPGDASEEPAMVYGDDVDIAGFDVGENTVAYVYSEWDHPGDVFVTTRGGNELHRLTRINDDYLADRPVRQPEEVRFERDGESIQGWLLTPPAFDADAASDETYPLVVEVHGGPHAHWTTSGTMWHEFQTLAARGYVVFWCNPRGSTGYGEGFATAIERDWGAATLADVLAGVDAVREREFVDADEAFITGGSFGGFLTAWAVTQTDRFRAAVAQRGVYDLTGFYGSTDAFKLLEGDFDATPWDEPDFLWEQSPASGVPDVDTPTLVLHADRDYRTPANTAELFYRGLKKHRVDTRLVRYPREGHELSRSGEPAHVVDRIERIARWFDGYSDHHEAPPALERERGAGLSRNANEGGSSDD